MDPVQIIGAVAAWAVTVPLALGFFKAGKFKATASRDTLIGAGFGWVTKVPFGLVRLIAWLELVGVAGIVLAPIASELLGLSWAQPWAVAAAAGLALTMVVAFIMHGVRGELKYTAKGNLSLFAMAAVVAVLLAFFGAPLF